MDYKEIMRALEDLNQSRSPDKDTITDQEIQEETAWVEDQIKIGGASDYWKRLRLGQKLEGKYYLTCSAMYPLGSPIPIPVDALHSIDRAVNDKHVRVSLFKRTRNLQLKQAV